MLNYCWLMGCQPIGEQEGESIVGGLEMRDRVPVGLRHPKGAQTPGELIRVVTLI